MITVNPLPTVDAGADVSVCAGGQVTLTATFANVILVGITVSPMVSLSPLLLQQPIPLRLPVLVVLLPTRCWLPLILYLRYLSPKHLVTDKLFWMLEQDSQVIFGLLEIKIHKQLL